MNLPSLVEPLADLVRAAGHAIMPYYHHIKALKVQQKLDNTPVTAADVAAHTVIMQGLQQITPSIPAISEEANCWAAFEERVNWPYCWLVDPLDGTRGFIDHLAEFTVNVALIHQHQPVLGMIYEPVHDQLFYGLKGQGAYHWENGQWQPLPGKKIDWQHLMVMLGNYHKPGKVERLFQDYPFTLCRVNSSLKFGKMALGEADIYPRFGPTSEWDTAAGHCILKEVGGDVVDFAGQSLQYNAKDSLLNPYFVALTDCNAKSKVFNLLKKQEISL